MTQPDARQQLAAVPEDERNIYNNTLALRRLVEDQSAFLLNIALGAVPNGGNSWSVGNYSCNILPSVAPELPAALCALRMLETSDRFKDAEKRIVPILAAVAELEKAEAEAALEREAKRIAHDDALSKAREAALAKVANDPEVVKARRALEAVSTK